MVPKSKMLQLAVRIDALFEHLSKAQINKDKYVRQKATLFHPESLTKAMDGFFNHDGNGA